MMTRANITCSVCDHTYTVERFQGDTYAECPECHAVVDVVKGWYSVPARQPDISAVFHMSFTVEVPLFGAKTSYDWQEMVKQNPQSARQRIIDAVFGDNAYEGGWCTPSSEDIKLEFVRYVDEKKKDAAQGLLPPATPEFSDQRDVRVSRDEG